jgi:hypothetical protein
VRRDAETLVEFFETPWTGISVTAALTITPGGINGHGPTFAYDLCADLQAIAACACEPDPGDLVPIVQGGSCVLATWPTIDVCDQMGALPVGALVAGDTVMLRDVGGNCKQVDATALAIPFDGGVITTPILAADGACATPSYSFTSAPDSGMFFDPASPVTCNGDTAVVIGWQNCTSRVDVSDSIRLTAANTDFFEVGCSIQGTSATGPVQFEATTGSMSLNAGTSLTANAGTLLNLNAGDLASLVGGTGVSIISLVNDIHLNADTGNIILQSNSGIFTVSGAVGAPQIVGPDGSCANPTYSFNSDGTTGMFFDPLTPALMLGHDTCDSFIRIGDIIRIEAANGDFVEYGASMLTQIAGGTRIQLSQAAPIVGRGVSNLFSLFAAGDTQAALIIGGNATAIAAAGEGWLRGGDSNFAGQNGASVVMDGGDANAAGAVAGDAIIAAGRGTLGGTPGNILLRTNALTRFSVNAAGALGIGDPAVFGAAGQVITSAGAGAPPAWATPTVPVGSTFNWGANNINSAADTRVMTPGFLDGLVNTNTPRGFVAPRAGMLRNLFARHNIAAGNGNAVTYTIRLNGVATALTVNLATAAIGSAGNTVNTVAVAQGDLIELLTIKAVAIGSGVLDAMVTCQFN